MLTVPTIERIDQFVLDGFKAVREGARELDHPVFTEIRASNMPICPRAIHISRRLPRKRRPSKYEKFRSEAATLMGTALHLVLQKWFALMFPDHFFGDWECIYCRKIRRHKTGVQICQSCGREMIYRELVIKKQPGIPFSGHTDGILAFTNFSILLDYKGSYQDRMRSIKVERKPVLSHFYQTNAYACAINSGKVPVGNLPPIKKIIIIYIDRGRPHVLWNPMQVSPNKRIYKQTKQFIKEGNRSLKTLTLPRGFCMGPKDDIGRWCDWNPLCFSPILESQLGEKIYKEKAFAQSSDYRLLDYLVQAEFLKNQ